MICPKCKLDADLPGRLPVNPNPAPRYNRCPECLRRLPEGKVYLVEDPTRGHHRLCVQCGVSRRQVGLYCCYCVEFK